VEPERHPFLDRLHERRERHAQRGLAYRAVFAVGGFALVAVGIVLSLPLVPGPGIPLIALGLAVLALEFDWAERLLERVVRRVDRVLGLSPRTLVVVATVVVAAATLVSVLWDVPYLPV
jgi:uncharacterized protein (TIGR02611 family)